MARTGWRGMIGLLLFVSGLSAEPTPTPEERFPPLVVPAGFRATLFAADPLVEYPSVIALGPEPHTLFVAHDYMTGLGTEIVRRDEIRLLRDADGDGDADTSTLYAEGFNSIQGLAYHPNTVFVMHAPLLTALRDTDGDGVADERRDLLSGLGLEPEKNPTRLHCANGVAVGQDGWLYLALGDNGIEVTRPEGDRLVLHGGGILRCRPDGRDLHVFSSGLRNIYDIALDAELNVFVRDNENDGGDYMIRVCHSFPGADHGYPYLYYEHPDEALPSLADLGRGSSAGGVCYLESAFPSEMRGNLFFCEWGRAVVRYDRQPEGSSFAQTKEIDFASGAPNDPYGFKPTDLVVDRDGSLLVSDWGDGQRPKRGRGRIYRISYPDQQQPIVGQSAGRTIEQTIQQLDAPGWHARLEAQEALMRGPSENIDALIEAIHAAKIGTLGRVHGIWAIVHCRPGECVDDLFRIAQSDPEPAVRVQAVRALADLSDPVLLHDRLDAGRGDESLASRLAALANDQHPRVVLEIIVALGRLRWKNTPSWLQTTLVPQNAPSALRLRDDPALSHAIQQTLRRCDNWPDVLKLLDSPESPLWQAALRAFADRADSVVVDGLMERLSQESDAARRREYALLLARVYKQPGPWAYWGYRPAPRPANTVAWERTEAIEQALDRALKDPDRDLRTAVLKQMLREQVPLRTETLAAWLQDERSKDAIAQIILALKEKPQGETIPLLQEIVRRGDHDVANRLAAVDMLLSEKQPDQESWMPKLIAALEDGPVLAAFLRSSHLEPNRQLLLQKLDSQSSIVRVAALGALVRAHVQEAIPRLLGLLHDDDPGVRRAAAAAAGSLRAIGSAERLHELARGPDVELRSICLDSLRQLRESRGIEVAVAALEQPAAQRAALDYLAELGSAVHTDAVVKLVGQTRSHEVVAAAINALANWESQEPKDSLTRPHLQEAIAQAQGVSGVVMRWSVSGPAAFEEADTVGVWRPMLADRDNADARLDLGPTPEGQGWLASAEVFAAEPSRVQFLASSSGTLRVWLNGRSIFDEDKPGKYQPDSLRIDGELAAGVNHLRVYLTANDGPAQFHLRFRRIGSSAEHERLTQYVLQNSGNAERGRELFLNAEKSLCVKCHRLGEQGGRIGPDLSGIGSRFSRIHLIESILDPSRAIAPSYETTVVALDTGRMISGIRITEDERVLTLGDQEGRVHEIPKSDIEERQTQAKSTMPDGLEKRLTDRELLDLLAFLLSLKKIAGA